MNVVVIYVLVMCNCRLLMCYFCVVECIYDVMFCYTGVVEFAECCVIFQCCFHVGVTCFLV